MVSLKGVVISLAVTLGCIAVGAILNFIADRRMKHHKNDSESSGKEVPQVTAGSPQTLREQTSALAGDLCGYLIEHRKELNPPDDPNSTGFEFIPDDLEIVSSFEQKFGERLRAVRLGLGNAGMLLSDIGEVLENGATNADDVRRIVDRLKDSVGLLDSRCGTKAPAATIKPDPCAGLFTPLQMEAFQLARDIRTFLRKHRPRPIGDPSINDGTTVGMMLFHADQTGKQGRWRERLIGEYDEQLKGRVLSLRNRFRGIGPSNPYWDSAANGITSETDLSNLCQILDDQAIMLDSKSYAEAIQ